MIGERPSKNAVGLTSRNIENSMVRNGEKKKKKVNYSSAWAEARKLIWNARWRLALGSVLLLDLAARRYGVAVIDQIHR